MNSHPYFGFPPHIQQSLLELYSEISPSHQVLGKTFFSKRQLSVRSWNPDRYAFTYHLDFGDTSLIWNAQNKNWKTTCDCRQKSHCSHVAAVIHALIGSSQIEDLISQQTAPPQNSYSDQAMEKLGRPLNKKEQVFLTQAVSLWQDHPLNRHHYIQELLNPTYAHVPQLQTLVIPAADTTFDEFWSMLAFQVRKIKALSVPEFMKVFEDEKAAQKKIQEILWQKEVEQWKSLITRSTQENSPSRSATERYDVRLVLADGDYHFSVKSEKQTEFKVLSKGAAKRVFQEFISGHAHVIPEAMPVFYFLKDSQNSYSSYFGASSLPNPVAQSFAHLAMNPEGRQRIFTSKDKPFDWPEEPVRWTLKNSKTSAEKAEYELTLPDGTPLSNLLMLIPCSPPYYVTATAIYRGPPLLANPDPYDSPLKDPVSFHAQIPVEALLSPEGIHFLASQQLPPPPVMAKRMKPSPLHLHILVNAKCKYGQDFIFFTFSAVHESGGICAEYQGHSWIPVPHKTKPLLKNSDPILLPDYSTLPDMLNLVQGPLKLKSLFEGSEAWGMRRTASFHKQFVQWLDQLPPGVDLTLPEDLNAFREPPIQASFRLECAPAENLDWFDLKVVVQTQDVELTPDELKALVAARGKFVELPGKGWRRMTYNVSPEDNEKLARLGLQAEDLSDETHRLHALQLADPAAEDLLSRDQYAEIRRRAARVKTQVTPPVPAAIQATLRPYQIEGFHFLSYLAENAFGGILADDMGLGKTLQALAWLAWLREKTPGKPSLVVCPKSVADNWHHEGLRFFPGLKVVLWRGSSDDEFLKSASACDLMVINYSQLRTLSDAMQQVSWLAAILDEGQYIKNPQSLTATTARQLQAAHRLVLTGTPIENRLLDLWSLMGYCMPGLLGPQARFTRQYDRAGDPLARQRLSARVRPFLLRRTKTQVAPELPPRTEEDLLCDMTPRQETLYRAELKAAQMRLLNISTKKQFDSERFNFLTSLLRLRQICCHPNLFAEENSAEAQEPGAKEEALLDLLDPLMEEGHKVLVFSQFVSVIERLELLLAEREWKTFVLTGETEDRGKLVEEFQSTEGSAIFLISLKAGGFGLNLTAASYVVLFDPWWNPAVENQAIDRTHRIGQTRPVIAYRLIARNSIEEKIRLLQRSKSALASAVLGEEQFAKALTLDDLRFLLENS